MDYNKEKVDEVVLALLYLNAFDDQFATRAWKSLNWDAMDHLYEKGYISDPKGKAKSVVLTEKGRQLAKELFEKYFGTPME
jgi:predicted transcriptional regulator